MFIGIKGALDIHHVDEEAAAKFWSNVDKSAGWGCWRWLGTVTRKGYGRFKINGRACYAHRLAWALVRKTTMSGMDVRHTCNDASCVNPWHLFLSARVDTVRSNGTTGKSAGGERHGRAKLRAADVRRIRRLLKIKLHDFNDIAEMYGVSAATIRAIDQGRTWRREQPIDKKPSTNARC